MQVIRTIYLGVVLLPALAGCSYLTGDNGMFRDRQGDYLVSPTIAPMVVSAELDSFTLDELYVVPPALPEDKPTFLQAPAPRPLDTNIREGVVLQRFGDRRWIVIGAEPAQVWPRLRDYWATAGIELAAEDPVGLTMETAWQGEAGSRNKYQVRIEPALHAGNSEVYVVQVGESYVADPAAPINWPTNSASLELEHAMLDSVSVYLADRTDLYRASSVSLLAGSIEAESKASIVRTNDGETLLMRIDFDRAWSQVGQALNNAEIEITSSDRDQAYYSVTYTGISEEDEPGFLGRLLGGGDNDDGVTPEFTIRLITTEGLVTVIGEQTAGEVGAGELGDQLIRTLNNNLI